MRSITCPLVTLILLVFTGTLVAEAEPGMIFDVNTIEHQRGAVTIGDTKMYPGTLELVDGKFGKAVRFSFVDNAKDGFMTARVRPTEAWDQA